MSSCPAPNCERVVGLTRYACGYHWRLLPARLRIAIMRAWGRRRRGIDGAVAEHEDAKAAADAWLQEHVA